MNTRPRPYRSGYFIPVPNSKPIRVVLRNPDKSIWDSLKAFINILKINKEFTRQQLIKYIYITHMDQSTVDTYNNQLITLGVIKKISRGRYIKIKRIPQTLSTKKLRDLTNKKNWRSWFIDTDLME